MNVDNASGYCAFLIRKDVYCGQVAADETTGAFPAEIGLRKDKVTVGRSMSVDCCIMTKIISKLHAIFVRTRTSHLVDSHDENDYTWTVTDNNSTNGVFVNGNRVAPNNAQVLRPKNDICFHCTNDSLNTIYIFLHESNRNTTPTPTSLQLQLSSSSSSMLSAPSKEQNKRTDDCGEIKRKRMKITLQRSSETNDFNGNGEEGLDLRTLQLANESLEERLVQLKREYEENLRDQAKSATTQQAEIKLRLQALEMKAMQAEDCCRTAKNTADGKILELSELLNSEKLKFDLVQLEISKLNEGKCMLEKALQEKTTECIELQQGITETKEPASQQSSSQSNNVLDVLRNILDAEYQCSICSELFYKATTLQCSHTFCGHCISQWQQKKSDCPICRQPVITFVPTIVVDGFIDKIIDFLPADIKDRRKESINERNVIVTEAATVALRRSSRRRLAQNTPEPVSLNNSVIELASSSSGGSDLEDYSENGSSNDSFDSEADNVGNPGLPGAYYGGYGHCYVCGEVGHWANGCPYR